MVRTLHRAGHRGDPRRRLQPHRRGQPARARRCRCAGIDNSVYYRLCPDDPRYYLDYTGTGQQPQHPPPAGHGTGHRQPALLGDRHARRRLPLRPGPGAGARRTRPVSRAPSSRSSSRTPCSRRSSSSPSPGTPAPTATSWASSRTGWSEWNGAFRDCVRRFWRGDPGQVPELASRLTGSSDIYAPSGRRTYASINFVTCHDGFTLTDLVSYEHKHNEANGEDNRDGTRRQLQPELGRGGPSRLGADRAGPGPDEAELPGHAVLLPGRAHAARRRRDRPDPAGQQQCLLPGQRDQLVRLGRRRDRATTCATSSATSSRSCRATPSCAGGASSPESRSRRPAHQGCDLDPARRAGDDRGGLGGPQQPEHRHAAVRPGRRRGRHPGPVRRSADTLLLLLNAGTRSRSYTLPAHGAARASGRSCSTRRARARGRARCATRRSTSPRTRPCSSATASASRDERAPRRAPPPPPSVSTVTMIASTGGVRVALHDLGGPAIRRRRSSCSPMPPVSTAWSGPRRRRR